MRRRHDPGSAVEIVLQGVVRDDGNARLRRSLPRRDRRDQHLGELVANAFVAERWIAAIQRLETAGDEAGRNQRDTEPRHCANDLAAFTPPH